MATGAAKVSTGVRPAQVTPEGVLLLPVNPDQLAALEAAMTSLRSDMPLSVRWEVKNGDQIVYITGQDLALSLMVPPAPSS